MNRAVRVRLLCLTLLLYAIQAQLWIWVLHKKPVFSKSLVATAAAAATPIARLLVSICICRMFPDREFNSIYKFYAFITINSRTMKPRLIPRSIAKSEAETDSNFFSTSLCTFNRIKHDKNRLIYMKMVSDFIYTPKRKKNQHAFTSNQRTSSVLYSAFDFNFMNLINFDFIEFQVSFKCTL